MGRHCERVIRGNVEGKVRRFVMRVALWLDLFPTRLFVARPVVPTSFVGEASSGDVFKLSLPLCAEFLIRAVAGFGDAPLVSASAVDLSAILIGAFRVLNVAVIVLSAAATVFTACVTWATRRKRVVSNGCEVVDDRMVVRIGRTVPLRAAFWFAVRSPLAVSLFSFIPDIV